MTTIAARPGRALALPDIEVTWSLVGGLAWWWVRFGAAWLVMALRELARALPGALLASLVEVARLVFVTTPMWAWRLPRENQAVLALSLVCAGGGVWVAQMAAADPRSWIQVFGPPLWVLGGIAALFIAYGTRRPIVALVPFGGALWWISPKAAVLLVALTVFAVTRTETQRTPHGRMTSRGTLTGARIVGAHHDAPRTARLHDGGVAPGSRFVSKHEGGHAAVFAAVPGAKLIEARAFADGSGFCAGKLPCRKSTFLEVVDDVALFVGGEVAVHSSAGCSSDHACRNAALARLDADQQPMARTAGYAAGRRAQSTHGYIQRRVMLALMATGRYDH